MRRINYLQKISLLCLFVLGYASASYAQNAPEHRQKAEKVIIQKNVETTTIQKAINTDANIQLDANHQEATSRVLQKGTNSISTFEKNQMALLKAKEELFASIATETENRKFVESIIGKKIISTSAYAKKSTAEKALIDSKPEAYLISDKPANQILAELKK